MSLDVPSVEDEGKLFYRAGLSLNDNFRKKRISNRHCPLIEATNSIVAAYDYCVAAIERRAHCVLMNAEVDLIPGHLLQSAAMDHGVVVTSDSGDQHGVLARIMEEVEMWGFDIVQAGKMKGFLDRYRAAAGTIEIARSLNLSTVQCLAYTDGSKLNIEMSVIANEYGLTPLVPGMEGPKAEKVQDVLGLFDFDAYSGHGRVDYILGAGEHRSGVYVVGKCDSAFQQGYMDYYKVYNKQRVTDCFAYAKKDLWEKQRVSVG